MLFDGCCCKGSETSTRQITVVLLNKAFSYYSSLYSKLLGDMQHCRVCLFLARHPPVGHGLFVHEVSRSHTTTHHSRYDFSGRVISSSQRPLSENTQYLQQKKHPCPQWDSKPQSQQKSCCRHTP